MNPRRLTEAEYRANAFKLLRDRNKTHGSIVVPERSLCQACNKSKNPEEMHRIADTGVVKGVQDCVCEKCFLENTKALGPVSRIVCVGCKEVVGVVEPFKERTGFVWRAGRCYHVAECPACTKRFSLKQSDIAEKIYFYKLKGIPYR